jgi:hypothetical protein
MILALYHMHRQGVARCSLQVIGHLVVPSALYGEAHFAPSQTIYLVLWLPTALGLTIRLLNSDWRIGINCFEYAKRAWRRMCALFAGQQDNDVERVAPQSLARRHQLQRQC